MGSGQVANGAGFVGNGTLDATTKAPIAEAGNLRRGGSFVDTGRPLEQILRQAHRGQTRGLPTARARTSRSQFPPVRTSREATNTPRPDEQSGRMPAGPNMQQLSTRACKEWQRNPGPLPRRRMAYMRRARQGPATGGRASACKVCLRPEACDEPW